MLLFLLIHHHLCAISRPVSPVGQAVHQCLLWQGRGGWGHQPPTAAPGSPTPTHAFQTGGTAVARRKRGQTSEVRYIFSSPRRSTTACHQPRSLLAAGLCSTACAMPAPVALGPSTAPLIRLLFSPADARVSPKCKNK